MQSDMKRLGITQRVENVQSHDERRDCLDQRWAEFAMQLGYLIVPLPNIPASHVLALLNNLQLDAILLSGGNSISVLNPAAEDAAPERDAFEVALLQEAMARDIPIVGICRGMQLINAELGGRLSWIKNHVAVRHQIKSVGESQFPEQVNSYHAWSISATGLAAELTPLALDQEGNIEAFVCIKRRLLGIMWHPEREAPFNRLDIKLIKKHFS